MTTATLQIDRRQFLGTLGAAAGLTLAISLPGRDAQAATTTPVNSWLTIGSDDSITLTIGSSDMGQGSFAGLAQILCEDLMVHPGRVKLVQGGPTLATPAPVGAAMARVGDASRSSFSVTDGVVLHAPSGTRLRYGDLAAAAALLTPPASAPLVPDDQLRCIGKTLARPDIPFKVDGSAVYGLDVRVAGMVYAVVRHCPSFGGTLAAVPPTPAGMLAVVPLQVAPGTGRGAELVGNTNAVAVVGSNTWDAWQAARRLSLKWTLPASVATMNSAQFTADAQRLLAAAPAYVAGGANPPGTAYTVERSTGDAVAAIAGAAKVLEATYALPYVAHACMEVLNCTVDYVAGQRCEVWAPTQSARGALQLVVALTGLLPSQVTLHTTFLGGGLGRKAEQDFIGQAVQVAMKIGKPVKLMWPREEDFSHDQYRPMALVGVRAGLDINKQVTGWRYRNVSPSILGQRGAVLPATGDSQGWEASKDLPYNFGTRLVEWVSHPSPVPVGFWRSVGASINTFAVESMVDELATAAGQDPLLFRRSRLTDPRWLAVLEAAANAAGWSSAPPSGTARGIAVGAAFNTIVAQVVEVANANGVPRITRVWVAVDSTVVVNPGSVEAQIVGGVVHAIYATLYGRQTFTNGAAQVKNFNKSRMIKLKEMPTVAVVLMPPTPGAGRTTPIGGIGELGVPTLAPALANAWARLTGQRVRTLPFQPDATMSD
jgi:isoquinoline 1-oxidoreductase subunit beta